MTDGLAFSVWNGTDKDFLERAIDFYCLSPPTSILDCTVNEGRFWNKSKYMDIVTGMDVDPKYAPDVVDDNRVMGTVADQSFDVLVYDPPHLPNQGVDRTKDFCDRFGLGEKSGKDGKYSFSQDFVLFAKQAARVLRPGGVLFAKVTDYVHNHRYQWALVDWIAAVRAANLTPCDLVIKVRKGPIMDPKWKTRHHVRKQHCYWTVVRNSPSCER